MISDAITLEPAVQAFAQTCRDLLGLQDYEIVFRYPSVGEDLGDGVMGCVILVPEYLEAIVTLRPEISFDETCETILHEMLHIVLAPFSRLIDHIVVEYAPKQAMPFIEKIKSDLEEQIVTRTQRALFKSIRPTENTT